MSSFSFDAIFTLTGWINIITIITMVYEQEMYHICYEVLSPPSSLLLCDSL